MAMHSRGRFGRRTGRDKARDRREESPNPAPAGEGAEAAPDGADSLDDVEFLDAGEAEGRPRTGGPLARAGRALAGGTGRVWQILAGGAEAEPPGPEDARVLRVAAGAVGGLAFLFLVLTILGFSMASGRGARLAEAERKLAEAGGAVTGEVGAAEWKRKADEASAALKELNLKKGELDASLAASNDAARRLQSDVERLTHEKKDLVETVAAGRDESVRKAHDEVVILREQQERAGKELADARDEIAALRRGGERAGAEVARLKDKIERLALEREQSERDLRRELAERAGQLEAATEPLRREPLAEDEAERRYREAVDAAAAMQDRDERIEAFRRLMFDLSGTMYGPRSMWLWNREKRAKQAEIDQAAAGVYKEAIARVNLTPKAYQRNIETLSHILAEVQGSKYEKIVEDKIKDMRAKLDKGR